MCTQQRIAPLRFSISLPSILLCFVSVLLLFLCSFSFLLRFFFRPFHVLAQGTALPPGHMQAHISDSPRDGEVQIVAPRAWTKWTILWAEMANSYKIVQHVLTLTYLDRFHCGELSHTGTSFVTCRLSLCRHINNPLATVYDV